MTDLQNRYYSDLEEVREADNDGAANELLDQGFELLAVKEKAVIVKLVSGQPETTQGPCYIMGRFGGKTVAKTDRTPNSSPAPSQSTTSAPTGHTVADLEKLDWQPSKEEGWAPWIPADKAPAWVKLFFEEHGRKTDKSYRVNNGNITYTWTYKSGNLNRYDNSKAER